MKDLPATEKQLKYARDLGLTIPEPATHDNVGFLINQALRQNPRPNSTQLKLARELGIATTKAMSAHELKELIEAELDRRSLSIMEALPFLKKGSKIIFEGELYRISWIGKIRGRWTTTLTALPSNKRRTVSIPRLSTARDANSTA